MNPILKITLFAATIFAASLLVGIQHAAAQDSENLAKQPLFEKSWKGPDIEKVK